MADEETPTGRALKAVREEWTKPYIDALADVLGTLEAYYCSEEPPEQISAAMDRMCVALDRPTIYS
jgi:hypothetical protein